MDDLLSSFKYLARRYHGRWAKLDDAIARIRAHDGNRSERDGERARRLFENALAKQTYVSEAMLRLSTDRANAMKELAKPLSEALGHIVTIELADKLLAEMTAVQKARWKEIGRAEHTEQKSYYGPLIQALHANGVNRGAYTALTNAELTAIAKYIRRKVENRVQSLPKPRTDAQTRGLSGRLHMFWNPFRLSRK